MTPCAIVHECVRHVSVSPPTSEVIRELVTMPRVQVGDLGKGSFGVTKLMRHIPTGELVAVKLIERGSKVLYPYPSKTAWMVLRSSGGGQY